MERAFCGLLAPRMAYEIEIEIKLGPSETRDATKIIFFLPGVPHRSVTVRAGSGNFSEWGVTG